MLATDYPDNNGKVSLMYIHTRNLAYIKNGYEVVVLNFSAEVGYLKDGIRVITFQEYKQNIEPADILLCHAANLRNHYKFLKKYQKLYESIVFFYHGHEVLKINKVYSKPYFYKKENGFKVVLRNWYDSFKLHVWRKYLPKIMHKSKLIFVSNWMKNEFEKWVFPLKDYSNRVFITYNCVGKEFETLQFDSKKDKEYDFITVRSFLDGSKYAVDLVIKIASKYPQYKFCVIGRGEIFKYFGKPDNITWIDRYMSHDDILAQLNNAKFALMPTRTDAQGLMACEMATFGMPLITSTIPVCYEIFDSFKNVAYIDNDSEFENFDQLINNLSAVKEKNTKYFECNTIANELQIFEREIQE